jgi:hypothetical protein
VERHLAKRLALAERRADVCGQDLVGQCAYLAEGLRRLDLPVPKVVTPQLPSS